MSAGEPLTSKPTGPLPNLGQAEAGEGGRCKRVGDIRCGGAGGPGLLRQQISPGINQRVLVVACSHPSPPAPPLG